MNGTTYDLPLASELATGWGAISRRLDVRVIGRRGVVASADPRFRLVAADSSRLRGRMFYPRLPPIIVREARRFRPDVVVAQSPYEAFACLGARPLLPGSPKLLVQVHGDWRTASRMYGSQSRRWLAPLSDRAAATALRRADGTRTVGPFTTRLAEEVTGRPPIACYPAYFDLASFTDGPPKPFPEAPTVAWVGMLERTKNVDGFAEAWNIVAQRHPEARLTMIGSGRMQSLVDGLVTRFPGRVTAFPRVSPSEVARTLDESTMLALPSRSEGTPRVVMEAFTRGRPVVASNVGGIPDLVSHERNGLLVSPDDPRALADAMGRMLSDPELAEALGRQAHRDAEGLAWTPKQLADALVEAVERLVDEAGPVARIRL